MFSCQSDEGMRAQRQIKWDQCQMKLKNISTPEQYAIAAVGLQMVMGITTPTNRTIQDWLVRWRKAYYLQEKNGWQQMIYGRLGNLWDCDQNSIENNIFGPERSCWSVEVIPILWTFGMDLWKVRNELLHGDGPISTQELERAKKLVEAVYREIAPQAKGTPREWVFNNEDQTRKLGHQSQQAWLASVKILSHGNLR